MHLLLWPPALSPTYKASNASFPHEQNQIARCASRVVPVRLVSLAHGSLSRRASNAHSREQYLPAFLPVPRLRNGFWQHRHCRGFARFAFASAISGPLESMLQLREQKRLVAARCLKRTPHCPHGLTRSLFLYRQSALQKRALSPPQKPLPHDSQVRSQLLATSLSWPLLHLSEQYRCRLPRPGGCWTIFPQNLQATASALVQRRCGLQSGHHLRTRPGEPTF